MTEANETLTWAYIGSGHCAYKTTTPSGRTQCTHMFSLSNFCVFSNCPIALNKYLTFQRQEDTLFLLTKIADGRPSGQVWEELELEGTKEEIDTLVQEKINLLGLDAKIGEQALKKFELLYQRAEEYRESFEEPFDEEE